MELAPDKKEIDGYVFEIQQLPAWDGVAVFGRLIQALGPALGAVSKLMATEQAGADQSAMLLGFLQKADIRELTSIGRQLLASGARVTTPEGKKLELTEDVFNLMFRGKLMTHLRVIVWAVKVNFSGFFSELKSAAPLGTSGAQPTSTLTKTSGNDGSASGSSTPAGQPSPS